MGAVVQVGPVLLSVLPRYYSGRSNAAPEQNSRLEGVTKMYENKNLLQNHLSRSEIWAGDDNV